MGDSRKQADSIMPFGKYKGKTIAEVPDTYLDWLLGQPWFVAPSGDRRDLAVAVAKELATRKRSHFHIEDDYGKTLEDL